MQGESGAQPPVHPPGLTTPKPARSAVDGAVRILMSAVMVVVLALLCWYFAGLIIYLMVGILVAYLLRPMVDRLQVLGLGRVASIMASFLLLAIIISVLVTFLVPVGARQISEITQQVSRRSSIQVTGAVSSTAMGQGYLQAGDVIVALDGVEVHETEVLLASLQDKQEGEIVALRVRRPGGETRTYEVAVGEGRVQEGETGDGEAIAALGLRARTIFLSDVLASVEERVRRIVPIDKGVLVGGVTDVSDALFQAERLTGLLGSVVTWFKGILYAVIVIPVVAFFFLKDGGQIGRSCYRLIPNRYFEVAVAVNEKIERNIGRYMRGLFIQSLSVATLATVLLSIAGLHSALAVGLFTGLANTIPYVGPVMGLIAGALFGIAQTGDFSLMWGVFLAMGVTQLADNIFFQPFIFSRAAQTHPLVILFVVLIGAQLAGIIGMLIAIPLTTIARVTSAQIYWSYRNYRILQRGR